MADWTELDTNGLLPGEPLTSAKALAFFENPVAMAEGAVDAPKVVSEALNMFVEAGTATTSYTDLGRIDKVLISCTARAFGGSTFSRTAIIRYRTSTDNGSSWSATTDIVSVEAAVDNSEQITGFAVVSLGSAANAIEVQVTFTGSTGSGSGSHSGAFSILGVSGVSP